ncbi:NmrA-like family protein [Hypoxylon fuscum]|nr:NmrA-like family protein [Hypoxylon fuscum]
MANFRNILIVGASGVIGTLRASSKFLSPTQTEVITIPDSYPTDDLVAAFKGQDVIINCMTTLSVTDQYRMIDAAIAAGVRRYVPSEYGLNNMRPDTQALNTVFHDKGKVQEYLREKAAEGSIEWMSIACGMWLKWGMAHDFVGMHVKEGKFVFWDDGDGNFSCTTEENTAAGLVRALKMPDDTKNMCIFLSDFAITQKQLLAAIEMIQGVKYATESVNSQDFIKEKQEAVRQGDVFATFGGHLEKEPGEIMNERLGLPKHTLDEVATDALRSLGIF